MKSILKDIKFSSCFRCPRGKFSGATQNTALANCTTCQEGSYCNEPGMAEGLECPIGYFCPAGKSTDMYYGVPFSPSLE